MKIDKDRSFPHEVREIFRQARAAEHAPARKHHIVPASHLRRWEEGGRVKVSDLERRASWITSAEKALRETDFYNIASEDLDREEVPPLLIETILGRLEAQARPAIDRLLETPRRLSPDDRFDLSNLMAFQLTRGRSFREEMKYLSNEYFKLVYGELTEDGIRAELSRRGAEATSEEVEETKRFLDDLHEGRAWVEPQRAQLVHQAAEHALSVAPHLFDRVWVKCSTPPTLPATDEPVVPVGGPGTPRQERGGVASAGVVLYPMAPDVLLVMVRLDLAESWGLRPRPDGVEVDSLDRLETIEVVHELLAHTTRYVIELPTRRLGLGLRVGPLPAAAELNEIATRQDEDGERTLIRLYKPNRWSTSAIVPPWPVSRWWSS